MIEGNNDDDDDCVVNGDNNDIEDDKEKKFMTPHVNEILTGNRAALWAKEREFIRGGGVYSPLSTLSLAMESAFHDAQTKNTNS